MDSTEFPPKTTTGEDRNIADRIETRVESPESEGDYRLVVENASQGIVIAQENTIRYANPKIIEYSGYTREELTSRPFIELIHPDDREMVMRHHLDGISGKEVPSTITYRIFDRNRTVRWVEVTGVKITWRNEPCALLFVKDISDRKRTEEVLLESEEKYRLVVENANEGIGINQDGIIRFVNPKLCEITGYSREELVSRPFTDVIHPEERETAVSRYRQMIEGKNIELPYPYRLVDKEGNIKWIEVNSVSVSWQGKPAVLVFVDDVTQRTLQEDKLRESESRYRELVENTGDLVYAMDGEGNFKLVNRTIEREYGYSASDLVGKGFREIVKSESYESISQVFKEQLKGIDVGPFEFDIFDKNGEIRTVESRERLLWEGKRVVEVHGIARDVTERRLAEAALRESEEKFRSLVENLNDVICSTDLEGRVTYVSPVIEQIIGYPVPEIIGRSITDFIYPQDLPAFLKSHKKTLNGQKEPLEFRAVHKNGNIIHVRTFSRRQFRNGTLVGLTGTITDITERVKAEHALRESEEKYRLVVENAGEGIAIADSDSFRYVNPTMIRYTGYSREELYGRHFVDFVHPDDRKEFLKAHRRLLSGNAETTPVTHRFIDRDGNVRWAEDTAVPITWEGKRAVLVFVKDATERKRIEEALRESEEKYRIVVENAQEIITVTVDGVLQFINRKALAISGYREDELLWTPAIDRVHPDDRHLLLEHRKKREGRGKAIRPLIMRLIARNGDIVWTENSIVPVLWQGKPAALNIASDITERKRIEDALRESEEKYRLVVENASEIIVISRDGFVKFANKAVTTIFGIPPEAMIGRHLSDLVIRRDQDRLREDYRKLTSGEEVLPFYRYRMHDSKGNICSIEVNGITITWEGQPCVLSFVSDITEKVRAEEEIKRRLRYEQAVAFCSQELVGSNDPDAAMRAIVVHLLEQIGVDGVFICKNIVDPVEGLSMTTVCEEFADCQRPVFDPPLPQTIAYKYLSNELLDTLSNGRLFGGPTKDYPPVEKEILTIFGCLSSIMIPIMVGGEFWGVMGFDDYETPRVWDEQDILLLQTISSMIGTIVARKAAETALTESEQRYRELVDSTSDIIYVADYRGNLKFLNDAVRQLGYEPDEVVGRNINEFYAPSSEKYAQELYRMQRGGAQIRGYELDIIRKDGQVRTIEFRDDVEWVGDRITEVRGIGRDVTDRKKMEDRLRLVAGSQEAVLNSLSETVFFTDLAQKITWANRAASRLTGFSIEELVGRFCYEVLHRKDAPCEGCPALISLSTGRLEMNNTMPCLGKNRRVTAYPVPDISGNVTGIAVSIGNVRSRQFLDISESFSHLDDDIEGDNISELFLAPLDPNYIYPFSLSIDFEKDTFNITLRWDEYAKEHLLKRLARSEAAVARFIYLAARMKTDGTGWVDKDIIRAGTMDTNLNKLRSLLEESNVPFLDRFSSRMLIRSNKEEKKKVRLALSASNIEISPSIRDYRSKKHRYMAAVSKKIKMLEREMGKTNRQKEYLVSELTIQRQNEANLRKSIEVVETLIGESAILLKF